MTKIPLNRKLYFALLSASIISIVAVLPYAFTLGAEAIKQSPLSLPLLVLVSTLQSSVLFAVVLFIGLKLSAKVGLGLPILEAYFSGKKSGPDLKSVFKTSAFLGLAVGLVIILVDFLFVKSSGSIGLWSGQMPPAWMGFLASFYGAISEEILLRLFLMSLLVWIFGKFIKSDQGVLNNNFAVWSAIVIAAIIFGLGHLPITGSVTAITPLIVVRAIVLNGIGGIVFGWLYWKKGLESAMLAHFIADIVLHVAFPLLISLL